jgi:hypothetical protein
LRDKKWRQDFLDRLEKLDLDLYEEVVRIVSEIVILAKTGYSAEDLDLFVKRAAIRRDALAAARF